MGRAPCCDKASVKRGPWSPEEDTKLKEYIEKHGTGGNWIALPQKAGLKRCGKSCRLRWLNYLRPNIKHGEFSDEEDRIICSLYANIGSRWSIIAAQLPGRTDNDIKNYWNTKLKKKLMALLPHHHQQNPPSSFFPYSSSSLQTTDDNNHHYYYYNTSAAGASTIPPTMSFTAVPPPPPSTTTSYYYNYTTATNTAAASSIMSLPFYQNQEQEHYHTQQQPLLISPMQLQQYYPMFGSEGSCSSSDGSCSYGGNKEIKKEEMMGFHHHHDEEGVIIMGCQGEEGINQWTEKLDKWLGGGNPLDYDLEVIKQLVISSNDGLFSVDENKTQEGMMMNKSIYKVL
ncbi:hypothetical protein PIB30_047579 [Stylosanthes scabra]|uniref:Uncharacterized protein n=1 Tax=Stylosanthes scabra TaxID=79078 RepID=A0ABU6WEV8_9FABA|nr:hypothetical protein [Stylosanthes scabra]